MQPRYGGECCVPGFPRRSCAAWARDGSGGVEPTGAAAFKQPALCSRILVTSMNTPRNAAPRSWRTLALLLALAATGWLLYPQRPAPAPAIPAQARAGAAHALPGFLPPEAAPVIARIQAGGAHPYRQDGSVFGNREGRLPPQPRGHYREYTVPTPGLSHRGARRIVTAGHPPVLWYYTDDHYASFRAFQPPPMQAPR